MKELICFVKEDNEMVEEMKNATENNGVKDQKQEQQEPKKADEKKKETVML